MTKGCIISWMKDKQQGQGHKVKKIWFYVRVRRFLNYSSQLRSRARFTRDHPISKRKNQRFIVQIPTSMKLKSNSQYKTAMKQLSFVRVQQSCSTPCFRLFRHQTVADEDVFYKIFLNLLVFLMSRVN